MKLVASLVLAALATSPVSAPYAATPAPAAAPSDAELLGARTVGVLPVLATGDSAEATWARVGLALSGIHGGHGALPVGPVTAELGGPSGLAFAGAAGDEDIRILRYGYFLGLVPTLVASKHESRVQVLATLAAGLDALAGLDPDIVPAVKQALASTTTVDGAAFARVLAAAQRGLAEGDPRRHGYLAAGMWLGLAAMAVWESRADATWLGMARPLATLLEEDAAFGAADRKVAEILRAVAKQLGRAEFDGQFVLELSAEVLEVGADPAGR